MSNLLKQSFAKTQLSRLPPDVPGMESFDENEEINDSSSSASSASSTGTIVPSSSKKLFERPAGAPSSRSRLSPLPWQDFFEQELFLPQDTGNSNIVHHAYLTAPKAGGPLFVTHHGAGSSGLSFATFTKEIRSILPNAGVLSLDARGHGLTVETPKPEVIDLGLETLSGDLGFVVKETQAQMKWESLPDIVLIGHSLGGAVTTELARRGILGPKVLAYAVLDVVEGSALDALQSMETYLSTRPTGFATMSSGIEWHSRSRTIRNITSARASVPALIHEVEAPESTTTIAPDPRPFKWRTDLSATKPFWTSWFTGLSTKFLTAIPSAGKLLLLAGTDRLDKELMIGQMQGKYQLQVFPEAGHFVHEDQPRKTAEVMADFWRRNDRTGFVMPPKVGQGKW